MGRNRRPFRATGGGFRNRQVHRDTGMPGWVRFISELLNNRTAGAGDDRTDLRNRAADMQAQLDDLKQRLADQDQG